ncbi:GGDEF domain-containing protein [Tepidibacillus marianensis]|uniref:GGDEF domain-containing protein n=1 Tax=Tepidibacillus marianensis TaxID=3131995 RepID=UPI0030CEEDD5
MSTSYLFLWFIGKQFDKAKFYSEKDYLTGVYNRRFLDRIFPKLMVESYGDIAVIVADVDHFKQINDTQGHKFGDEVLKEISKLFVKNIRKTDIVTRWGGDEFIIVMPDVIENELMEILLRMEKELDRTFHMGISIGTAIYPKDGKHLEDLIRKADQRMYKNKLEKKEP